MKIFIGSSKEAKGDMKKLAVLLERCNQKPKVIRWDKPGLFSPTEYTYENLINIAENVNAAIFIFNSDDKSWYRGDEVTTVRDNVLIEYGLFTGILGHTNVAFAYKKDTQIPSDLTGMTYLDLSYPENTLENEIQLWLDKIENNTKIVCTDSQKVSCERKYKNIFDKAEMVKKYEEFLLKAKEAYILVNDIDSFLDSSGSGQLKLFIELGDNCKLLCCKSNFINSYNNNEEFRSRFNKAYNEGFNKVDLRFFEKDRNKNIINIKGQFIYMDGQKIVKSLIVQKDKKYLSLFKLLELDNDYLNDTLFDQVKGTFNNAKKYDDIRCSLKKD